MSESAPGPGWRQRLARHAPVLALFALALGVHGWQWRHAEVISRDGIAFTRYAWQLGNEPWAEVLAHADRHPGYPAAVLAASHVVRAVAPGPPAAVFMTSAQLVSFLAGVLLVLPLYALGRELVGRRAAFVAVVLVLSLPAAGAVMVDAVTEPLFLLLAVTALWAGVRALRTYRPAAFAACGAFAGGAYLVRPEGLVIAAAVGAALAAGQVVRAHRRPWPAAMAGAACLVVAVAAVGSPLMAATGRLTLKPSAAKFWDAAGVQAEPDAACVGPLFAVWREDSPGHGGPAWAVGAVARVLAATTFNWMWVPAMVGLWLHRGRRGPGAWAVYLVALVMLALAWRVAATSGYLSKRHLLLVAFVGAYWAAVALVAVAARMRASRPVAAALLALLCLPGMVRSVQPLHADRTGYRDAGAWLAGHVGPTDQVLDPHGWAAFYCGRTFTRTDAGPPPRVHTWFVVCDPTAKPSERLPQVQQAADLSKQGEVVFRAPLQRGRAETLAVYAVPGGGP